MSTIGTTPGAFIAARDELAKWVQARQDAGPQQPEPIVRVLPWRAITTKEELFQHRSLSDQTTAEHVQTLAKAIHRGPRGPRQAHLEPITVWWDGRDWLCVDGHHSLAAYEHVKHPHPVPVRTMRGYSLDEAIRASLEANARDKLPYTKRCKSEAAWRLTVAGGYSKADIARLTEVSTRTVASMRDAIRTFAKTHPDVEPQQFTWAQIRHWLQHGQPPGADDMDIETKRQKQAERVYRKVAQHIKDVSLDTLLRVLELHKPGMVSELVKAHADVEGRWQEPDPHLPHWAHDIPPEF